MTTMTTAAEIPETDGHIVADQSEVAAFLAEPATYGPAVRKVQRIDTHGAMVFLAGDRAYKIKRAVKFSYMDFSTLARRQEVCERELRLNRRTAPGIYLETRPVIRRADGSLGFDGPGEAVEWVLVMRRFEQEGLFDRLATAGKLTPELMQRLTDAILRFHRAAEPLGPQAPGGGGAEGLRIVAEGSLEEFAERPDLFPEAEVAGLRSQMRDRLRRSAGLLDARLAEGFVRRCHGDLHLGNICLFDGEPTLFDCIEFNDDFAAIDLLYDLAFLLMDLEHRGLRPLANLVLNRYLQDGQALDGLAALPVFLANRALVRAKVLASAEARQEGVAARDRLRKEARRYFQAGRADLEPAAPRLLAVGGLSGTGKTTLARRLAPLIGAAPGALHLRSDLIRKQLWDSDELTPLPQEAYTADFGARVYAEICRRARQGLAAGQAVVTDAVFSKPAERAAIEAVAGDFGLRFQGLWLEAAPEVMIERVTTRRGDASDATAEVVSQQLNYDIGTLSWWRLDAAGPTERLAKAAAEALQLAPA